MGYDPATRILSLSFIRDPKEHADVMFETGRRMMTSTTPLSAWTGFGVAIGFGAAVGIIMEIHRRFVLPLLLGPSEVAPLGTIMVQLLPLVVLIIVLYAVLYVRVARSRRKALISRLEPGLVIDVDIFSKGITSSSEQLAVEIDWPAVRDVLFDDDDRIEIECESFSVYLPQRAFPNRAAFIEAAKDLRKLWREALKHERDSKMAAAGLD